jgi:YVTN family beta-propeller protein
VISDASNAVVATVNVGSGPGGMTYDSGKGEVFVSNWHADTVSVISAATNAVVATVNVGSRPFGVAYDSANGYLFVANDNANTTSVISDVNNTVISTLEVGYSPWEIAYDSAKGEIFVSNYGAANVSVISMTQVPEFPGFVLFLAVATSVGAAIALDRRLRSSRLKAGRVPRLEQRA